MMSYAGFQRVCTIPLWSGRYRFAGSHTEGIAVRRSNAATTLSLHGGSYEATRRGSGPSPQAGDGVQGPATSGQGRETDGTGGGSGRPEGPTEDKTAPTEDSGLMRAVLIGFNKIGLFDLAIFDRITKEGKDAEEQLVRIQERENFMSALLKGKDWP